jgi:hypothetical protein|tara:strand:- start:544 stop:696 length:153 start_codon:yes stop_codon:yes gene_type:complete
MDSDYQRFLEYAKMMYASASDKYKKENTYVDYMNQYFWRLVSDFKKMVVH